MDWRNRRYFLAEYSSVVAPKWMSSVPTVKCSQPYYHFKQAGRTVKYSYDGCERVGGMHNPSCMVGCHINYAEQLIAEFDKHMYTHWTELTPELCGH